MIFTYPPKRAHRRHGPRGYSNYSSYRPWLRDEFQFRCVYCLKRETWGRVKGEFDLDHFEPQSVRPDLELDYENLVYACRRCNAVKGNQSIENPFEILEGERVIVMPDATLQGRDAEAWRFIKILDLNSATMVRWRMLFQGLVALAVEHDPVLYEQLAGFPKDLPALDKLRPPGGNSRPQGLQDSWASKLQNGTLPAFY